MHVCVLLLISMQNLRIICSCFYRQRMESIMEHYKVNIEYEWWPSIYNSCNSFGHVEEGCPLMKKAVKRPNPKPVQIYVPKPNVEKAWHDQTHAQNNFYKEKSKEPLRSWVAKPVTKNCPRAEGNNDVIDNNPFALLENLEMEDIVVDDEENIEYSRGPIQAGPLEGVK